MATNEHKKDLRQLSEAYQTLYTENVDPGIENNSLLHYSERAALRQGAQLPELPVVNNIDEAINTLTSAGSRFGGPEGSAVTGENNAVKWVTRVLMYNNIEVPDPATIKAKFLQLSKVPPVEDAEHVFKNTEAGYEREDFKHKYSERVRAVNLAMQALKQLNDNIKHEYPDPEKREEREKAILPLVRAHNQLSIALIELVGEEDRNWIMGGQADAVAQSQLDFKPADGREW